MPPSLPFIPPVTILTPLVTRVLGHNPGRFTLQGTNSYLVGSPKLARVLIDTTNRVPGLETYLSHLKSQLEQCQVGCPLSAIILTHWHPDHTEGISGVLDLARQITLRNSSVDSHVSIPVYKHPGGPDLGDLSFFNGPFEFVHDNQVIPLPTEKGDTKTIQLRVLFTPGHAEDHICLLMEDHLGQAIALFTGDAILGHGSTTVRNLPEFMRSLYRIRSIAEGQEAASTAGTNFIQPPRSFMLFPAHGLEVTEYRKRIDENIANRLDRLSKTSDFLSKNLHSVWIGESELLRFVYPEVPQVLRMAALFNLRHSLFWIASDSEPLPSPVNSPRNSLIARISDGSERTIDVSEFYYLLDCFERSQSPASGAVIEDVKYILGTDWEWKFSA
ncbi:Beta-lactamase protein 2 [Paragonimus heterotremus]|uniref:Beta-lactamase protein 2 n=1 Tax=Paragonimus heterotremus TaxID=100268 RepID=A0A8J4WJL7_9TREM|nr:Beta-lactamase protein 2 [Paragonimus heterotremus]